MISFAQELERKMLDQLNEIALLAETDLQQAERSYYLIRGCMKELKLYCRDYTFPNKREEILFFKEIKPRFVREWMFYLKLFHLEASMPVGNIDDQNSWMKKQVELFNLYLNANQFIYVYYRTGQTYMDEQFFVNDPDDSLLLMYAQDDDPDNINKFSYVIGKIQAYEDLASYLLRRIDAPPDPFADTGKIAKEAEWGGNMAQLYELGYGIYAAGLARGSIKAVMERLGFAFHIKPGNYYRYMLDMRLRKKSLTQCLDLMSSSLVQYMSSTDLNPKYK